MSVIERLRMINKAEGLTQKALALELDIPLRTVEDYLCDRRKLSGELLIKVTNHPRFKKYALWLMTGEANPEAGQVCPSFSTLEQCTDKGEIVQKRA